MNIKPEYILKYAIGDNVYVIINGLAAPIHIYEIRINERGVHYHGFYLKNGCKSYMELAENECYETADECEKAYVLEKYGHLFKNSKTLK